jgi:hypothetical protein
MGERRGLFFSPRTTSSLLARLPLRAGASRRRLPRLSRQGNAKAGLGDAIFHSVVAVRTPKLSPRLDAKASPRRRLKNIGVIALQYVPSELQLADFFTKVQSDSRPPSVLPLQTQCC